MNMGENATQSEFARWFAAARRWWWLLVLGPTLAGSISYVVSSSQTPLYSATATLGVDVAQSAIDVDSSRVQGSKALTETYRQLVASDPVLRSVVAQLELPFAVEELRERIAISAIRDTQLLSVSVSDTNPALAATIANAIADQFGEFIAMQTSGFIASSRAVLEDQVEVTEQRIEDVTRQLDDLRSDGDATDPAGENRVAWVDVLVPEVGAPNRNEGSPDALSTTLASLVDRRQQLLDELDQLDQMAARAGAPVSLLVPANAPPEPYEPQPLRSAVIGVLAGLVLAAGAVVLLGYVGVTATAAGQVPRPSAATRRWSWRAEEQSAYLAADGQEN